MDCNLYLKECLSKELAKNKDDHGQMSWEKLYLIYPLYMDFETKYHNKAEYNEIVSQLKSLEEKAMTEKSATCWYLITLIDVIGNMSKEIFEHYKSLEEIFKKAIKAILDNRQDSSLDLKMSAMMGYSILKACNIGVLNSEKYAEIGLKWFDGVIENSSQTEDPDVMEMIMKAYAQAYKN